MTQSLTDARTLSPAAARAAFRGGRIGTTSGWAAGFTQVNVISVPADYAYDVLLFAQRNPKPCPVLDVTDAGGTGTMLADGVDLRTDLPLYRVWRDGQLVEELPEVTHVWRADLVTFLIGCSFTFETALIEAGVPLRHVEAGRNVAMYRTERPCRPARRLHGPLVVSMRPIPASLVPTAVHVTAATPAAHGGPVHVGVPAALGIRDLASPDFGDSVEVRDGDVPVFWACGVTLQAAVMASRPPFAISHAPGHMLVTDVPDVTWRLEDPFAATRANRGAG